MKSQSSGRRWLKRGLVVAGMFGLISLTTGFAAWYSLFRTETRQHEDLEEFFKYGSMGAEPYAGMPYWIWAVLPDAFADKLPQNGRPGYASFGFLYEEGRDVPIGISRTRVGFDRVANNCAMCHVSHVRESADSDTTFYLLGTNIAFDGQAYFNFMMAAANDPRFNADTLLHYIDQRTTLSLRERLLHRHLLIPAMREELLKIQRRLDWWYSIPAPGPGRWEAFNDLKYHFAQLPRDGSIGNPDILTIWNLRPREEIGVLHWDGFSDTAMKAAQNAAIGAGALERSLPREQLDRLVEWMLDEPAPKYPFPIDAELAAAGKPVWDAQCAACHEVGQSRGGRVMHIDSIGTDRERFDLITANLPDVYNRYARETHGWTEWQLRKTDGYAAVFLDGIWIRAPYLHNGSVPTLEALLLPVAERPVVFWRGYNVFDQQGVGFVASGREAEREGFRYDTRLPGNRNIGHEYGTDLSAAEKRALLEYLKTL